MLHNEGFLAIFLNIFTTKSPDKHTRNVKFRLIFSPVLPNINLKTQSIFQYKIRI